MTIPTFDELQRYAKLFAQVCRLPRAHLRFDLAEHPDRLATYRVFTQRHPRLRIVRNKTLGVALVDLTAFRNPADYLQQVRSSGHAAPQRHKALARGYTVRQIDRNGFIDEIHAINMSAPERQGRPMDGAYHEKTLVYDEPPHVVTYGAFDAQDKLSAYCVFGYYGNFAATNQLLGYKTQHGIMYLLLAEIICELIGRKGLDFFMYDTYLGAQPGLRDFKRRVGFRPYRARYSVA